MPLTKVFHSDSRQVIVAFSERAEEFRKSDCEVLAASTDSHFIHLAIHLAWWDLY